MATSTWNEVETRFLSVEEYLQTSYRPDCDLVDGAVEERNVGEYEHGRVQLRLGSLFMAQEAVWGCAAVTECRLQVAPDRFRVPDVMVLRPGQRATRIVREAPLICIEVLSPEDTWAKTRARLNDYLAMGVEHVWCFHPDAREVRRYTASGFHLVEEAVLTVPQTQIQLVVADIFAVLDQGLGLS